MMPPPPRASARRDHERRRAARSRVRVRRARDRVVEALPGLGDRMAGLRDRDQPLGRVHRARRAGDHRRRLGSWGRVAVRSLSAGRDDHLALPRADLRADGRDHRVGALGGHDRVHVHGAGATRDAPHRDVRRNAGARARLQRRHPRGGRALRPRRPRARERSFRAGPTGDRCCRVRRPCDRVGGVPFALDGERPPDGLHRPGGGAARLRRVLRDDHLAIVDAGPLVHLARDLRDPRHARGAPGWRGPRRRVAGPLAGPAGRRDLDPAGPADLPLGRAPREEDRATEAERMMGDPPTKTELSFRPATPSDGAFAADIETALRPDSPRDPVVYRYWWSQPDEHLEIARFIARRHDRDIGFATTEHARWDMQPERYAWVGGDVLPAERSTETLDAILAAMEERVVADGAAILCVWAYEDDPLRIETVLARGYKEDRRSRRWELDLDANREKLLAMTDASRARMRRGGGRIPPLAADDDPRGLQEVWGLSEEAGDDVPTTVPRVPEAMESYVRWANAPEVHKDRFWIARRS